MTALEAFKLPYSQAWDPRYDLPSVPIHNQPFLYGAYAIKIIKLRDGNDFLASHMVHNTIYRFWDYIAKCEKESGLYNRRPDGSGGITSHDELIGLVYIKWPESQYILEYLKKHRGRYVNTSEVSWNPFKWNLYRFPWFIAYLKARRDDYLSNAWQFIWSLQLLAPDLVWFRPDNGGLLRKWIMLDEMERHPISGWFIKKWRAKMKRLGIGPRKCFEHYLVECPVFREFAPEEF